MRRRAPRSCPIGTAGPHTTERRIENDLMVPKRTVHITPRPLESRSRCAPFARIGVRGRDVRRGGRVREEPNAYMCGGPLRGVDAAAVGVEAGAVGGGHGVVDRAADACGLAGGIEVAAWVDELRGGGEERGVVGDGAGGAAGVQGHEVRMLAVDAFDDVDFAICGPGFRFRRPEGGPRAAGAGGHVGEVEDDEAVRVGFVALHAEGHTAGVCGGKGGVDAHVDFAVVGFEVPHFLGGGTVGEGDIALGWVGDGLEGEGVEPVGCGVVVLEVVYPENWMEECKCADGDSRGIHAVKSL